MRTTCAELYFVLFISVSYTEFYRYLYSRAVSLLITLRPLRGPFGQMFQSFTGHLVFFVNYIYIMNIETHSQKFVTVFVVDIHFLGLERTRTLRIGLKVMAKIAWYLDLHVNPGGTG